MGDTKLLFKKMNIHLALIPVSYEVSLPPIYCEMRLPHYL
jgi:hypothetical protein